MTDQSTQLASPPARLFPAIIHRLGLARWSAPQTALLLACAITACLFALFHAHGFDDPFITYRYAQNLAQGHGFVYNPGARILSTTTPLFALLLAPAVWLGWSLPLVSNLLGCASLALGGLALWQLGQHWRTPVAGWAALLLYPLIPLLVSTLGSETALYQAWLLWSIVAWNAKRLGWAALLLALAALTRPDGVLLAALLLVINVWQQRQMPWRAISLYGAIGLVWCGFAWAYFGSPLPSTLATKQAQATMQISRTFAADLLPVITTQGRHPLYRIQVLCALLGVLAVMGRDRRWWIVIGWVVLYTAAYSALGVSSYLWYYAPLALGWIVLVALGVQAMQRWLRHFVSPAGSALAAASLLAVLMLPQLFGLRYVVRHPDQRLTVYRRAGAWLQTNTPPNATVATLEVGMLGYYSARPMIDFAGLIQPVTAARLTSSTTYQDAALWAIDHFRPAYLVLPRGNLPQVDQQAPAKGCRLRTTISAPDAPWPLDIYACESSILQ